MKYSKVNIESMGYELAPVVVSSADVEAMLAPLYKKLHIPEGQLEAWTGIKERRWWNPGGNPLTMGAVSAGRKALEKAGIDSHDVDTLIYAGVCREGFEPATACHVAAELGVSPSANVYDVSNACLGVLNGMVDVANRIELGHCKTGLVVSSESAREINEITIRRLLTNPTMENFVKSIATFTGGSASVAVLMVDSAISRRKSRKLVGGVTCTEPKFHQMCRWGMEMVGLDIYEQVMHTDSIGILKYGVELGLRTWNSFLDRLGWVADQVNRTVCHQVGSSHRDTILKMLNLPPENDYFTYPYLGNIGTVSLPITAMIAEEKGFLNPGDRVGFLGIGSGLNCMMLGLDW